MIKIINRKKYDTDTAYCIATNEAYPPRDFKHYEEELYQKENGEFFLHGKGGGLSKYASSIDNHTFDFGEEIIPLSEEEAREWVETYANECYEDIFGEVEE